MQYPKLRELENSRQMVDVFKGYNHNLRIGDEEFFDMKNMTSDYYPILSPRGKRGVYASLAAPSGLIAKEELCYSDGTNFVIGDAVGDLGLNDKPKQLISMGAYVIIMPDKKYVNTADLHDWGDIEASVTTTEDVRFELCTITGDPYTNAKISATAPTNPKNLDLWNELIKVGLAGQHQIKFEKVAAHSGHEFNEACDRLAKEAADRTMIANGWRV
jgi:hypothetical protein